MDEAQIHNLIVAIGSQVLILGTGLIGAYFKLKKQFGDKIQEVKTHTDISLQKLNGMLTYVINSFDRPAWIKMAHYRGDGEVEFRMLEMNDSYSSMFGIEKKDYIGKTDLEAGWDKHTADLFRKHDLAVWASGEAETFEEGFGGQNLRFRKIRIQSSDGLMKGIMGYAVSCSDPTGCPYWRDKKCAGC